MLSITPPKIQILLHNKMSGYNKITAKYLTIILLILKYLLNFHPVPQFFLLQILILNLQITRRGKVTRINRLVQDNTVHRGNSKRHKTDKKGTHFVVHISPSIFGSKINKSTHYTHHPFNCAVVLLKNKPPVLTKKRAPPFCQFFWLGSDRPKIFIIL